MRDYPRREVRHGVRRGFFLAAVVPLLTLAATSAIAQDPAAVVLGAVRDQGTGAVLPGAIVEIHPLAGRSQVVVADSAGGYRLADVAAGRSLIRARHLGHTVVELELVIAAGQVMELDIALPMHPLPLAPVTVAAERGAGMAPDSSSAGPGQLRIAGTRALETTPGLTELGIADAVRGGPGTDPGAPGGVLYVRGAPADLKLVYLDGAPIYAPFPLGGLMEPFAPGLLNRADIYLGGAPARYDGGLSYVMDLRTRAAPGEGIEFNAAADLLTARASAAAGLADRIGVVGAARGIHPGATSGALGVVLPYSYREGLIRGDARLGSTVTFSVTGFDNSESVIMGEGASVDSVIRWGNRTGSARLAGVFGRTGVEVIAARGDYSARLPFVGSRRMVAEATARRTRLSAGFVRQGTVRLRYGGSLDRQRYGATATATAPGDGQDSPTGPAAIEGSGSVLGAYLEATGPIGSRVRVRGGARADRFSTTSDVAVAPRVAVTWYVTDRVELRIAAGRYHQFLRPPDEILLSSPESSLGGTMPLAVARSTHLTVALDQDLGGGTRLGIEGFYKQFADVPGDLGIEANASGMDFWVRRTGDRVSGWLGYSLAWVWSDTASVGEGRASFRGRHLLNSGLEIGIRESTHITLRFAYGAGLPYSGIPLAAFTNPELAPDGTLSAQLRSLGPSLNSVDPGGTETAPLLYAPDEPFLRLDASVSSQWLPRVGGHEVRVEPYLKVLNGLARRDALFYFVNAKDDAPRAIGTLPVLPVAGVNIGF